MSYLGYKHRVLRNQDMDVKMAGMVWGLGLGPMYQCSSGIWKYLNEVEVNTTLR